MDVLPSVASGTFTAHLSGHKRKFEPIEAENAKKARANEYNVENESDDSDSETSDLTSNIDNDASVENSVRTPLTPLSSKASPRHPSDLKTIHCPYDNCNKTFNRPAKLSQHLRSHTNTRPFVCPHTPCTKDFLRESHLKHHVKSAHSDIRDYICEWQGCGKSFITATRLRRHHAAHEGREKFRCTVTDCGQTFRKHGTLQKHVTTFHEGRHPYVCELLNENGMKCGAGFDTEGRMESHAGRVHGTKKFVCAVCPCQQEENIQTHNLGKNGAVFPSHAALQAHIQNEHPPTCTECGLKCTSKSALKSHVEVLHGGLDVNERKVHVCPELDCGRAFTKKGNMNAHIQISHAGKRFVCGVVDPKTLNHVGNWDGSDACGEASTSKRNLERHICTIHLGLDPSGKLRNGGKHQSLAESANNNGVSALTRLTGSGYETETGRNVSCLVQGCNHRFVREYDLEIHLQSRHGLADLEIQAMIMEEEFCTRQSFQGTPVYATEQDLEAQRVFDQQFGNDVAMRNSGDSLESGTLGGGDLWLRGDPFDTATGDSWLHDEGAMQHLINEDYQGENVEGRSAQDAHNSKDVQNAIEVAFDARADPSLKSQAFDFINQLRSEPQGWQICFSLALRDPRPTEVVRHVSLDVVNNAIKAGQVGEQDFALLRDNMMAYVRNIYGATANNAQHDTISIQNKITQTMTNLFTAMYATQWTTFFQDILGLTAAAGSTSRNNAPGVLLYLRILISVHDEIADVLLSRSPEEQRRNNDLKDLVRQRDTGMIASSWHEILAHWKFNNDEVVALCLTTIGRWVTWTEISFAVNDSLLTLLFDYLGSQQVTGGDTQVSERRKAAMETFIDILGKKMSASDKVELIEVLKVNDAVSQLLRSRELSEMRSTATYDTDLAEDVARLVNNTVSDIVRALDGSQDNDPILLRGISQLKTFLPHLLRFLSDEYDEICSTVIPSLTDFLTLLRKKANSNNVLAAEASPTLPLILDVVIAKMKYDETFYWGHEDTQTDEAEFQELRRRLHILQKAVAAVDEVMYIEKIKNVVVSTFDKLQSQNGQLDWRDLELAMHELDLFGDLAYKHGGLYSKTKAVTPAAEQLIGMMFKLCETGVASFSHPAVQLQYMVVCERYYAFFEANPHLITPVLENFVRFLHHDHVKVRLRSWYLFHRFVKHVRNHVGDIAETAIQALSDLLPIKAELVEEPSEDDNDDVSSSESGQSANARFNSQLYLYEAIGCISSARAIPAEKQVLLVRSIANPLFSDLEAHLSQAKAGDRRATLQVHHLIMALGTLARGFSDGMPANNSPNATAPADIISEEFAQTAEAVLVALERLRSSFEIREASRFAFTRLIAPLGSRILPQLPRWIDGLLSETSTKDEMAMFIKLLDQVVFKFKSEIYDILNTLLTPFLQRVFAGIAEPVTGTDDEIQLVELKREYLGFLLVILNNGLESVLVSESNQPVFGTVISIIEHLAKDINDFQTAKLAFSVLTRMVLTWGGPDVESTSSTLVNGNAPTRISQPRLPGFDQFIMTTFSPLCWAIPSNPSFDSKDAQGKQVLGEAAVLQKGIYSKTGQAYLTYLRDVELSGMGMDSGTIEEYLSALCNFDIKGFQRFFQNLVQRSTR